MEKGLRSLKGWGGAAVAAFVLVTAPAAFAAGRTAAMKAKLQAKMEQLAMQALPTNEFRQALGFFGPVTKKYMPEFQKFNAEYLAAKDKMPVVVKYLPKAEAAYAEAQAMKVPAKYEAKKEEYLKMFNGFLTAVKMTTMFGG